MDASQQQPFKLESRLWDMVEAGRDEACDTVDILGDRDILTLEEVTPLLTGSTQSTDDLECKELDQSTGLISPQPASEKWDYRNSYLGTLPHKSL